ncbi:MAG TPA: SDR family oxidoreductase [Candidatus Bilamarchaeum sp.]|nr:SDR family oxidoreductase [Candidatus Bilamarchaeum sp.]
MSENQNRMQGKICLVTGATSGIGKATALKLAKLGATVVVMSRDKTKGEATVRGIRETSDNPNVELLLCDLSSLASVRATAEEFKSRYGKLDILVNDAAVFVEKRMLTKDGLELMFATNHLGPFLLTNLLLPSFKEASRVINLTAPSTVRPDFDDLQGERKFSAMNAFGASKAANLLFTFALARRLKERRIAANAYHPGIVKNTNLMRQAPPLMRVFGSFLNLFFGITPESAADGVVQLASSKELEGISGELIHKGKIIEAPFKKDIVAQDRLWSESAKLAGLGKR